MKSCEKVNKLKYIPGEVSVDLYAGINAKKGFNLNKSFDSTKIKVPSINFINKNTLKADIYGSNKKIEENGNIWGTTKFTQSPLKIHRSKNSINVASQINQILGIKDINDMFPSKSKSHTKLNRHNLLNRSIIIN